MLLRRVITPRFRIRTMSTVSDFVAAAIRADPNLQGLNDTDKAAINKLQGETERLSQDLSVGRGESYADLRVSTRSSPLRLTCIPTSLRQPTSSSTATSTPPW